MKKKILGISLLEVLLSLAIIAIILVLATRYFGLARATQQLNQATEIIQSIHSATQRWLVSHDDFSGISTQSLISRNLLPSNAATTPWGGDVTVESANNNASIKATLHNIPFSACENLLSRLQNFGENSCSNLTEGYADFVSVF